MRQVLTLSRHHQRGLSLVEMMVGVTIGLFVVAAASMLVVSQLGENRRLLLETQVQQDLRATADIVTRDLRRAGYNVNALNNVWLADQPLQLPIESSWTPVSLTASSADYRYTRANETIFQLSLANKTIYRKIGNAAPQPLTDSNTLHIENEAGDPDSGFSLEWEEPVVVVTLACPKLCTPAGGGLPDQSCWPTVTVRDLVITIEGRAASDRSVFRTFQSRVRVRNDEVAFDDASGQVCP
jgi:type IV pilus assembly protein PilW